MVGNNCRKYGNKHNDKYSEEYRRLRNYVVAFRNKSIANYFQIIFKCQTQEKPFWETVCPFMSDKGNKNGNCIILKENEKLLTDNQDVSNVFNEYFSSIASQIGFPDTHQNAEAAILYHRNHDSVNKIRNTHPNIMDNFDFKTVDSETMRKTLKDINVRINLSPCSISAMIN